jgi:hypothetical protein
VGEEDGLRRRGDGEFGAGVEDGLSEAVAKEMMIQLACDHDARYYCIVEYRESLLERLLNDLL